MSTRAVALAALFLLPIEGRAAASAGLGDCINVRDVPTTPATPCFTPGGPECADDDRPGIQEAIRLALLPSGPRAVCFPGGGRYDIRSIAAGAASFDLAGASGLLLVGDGTTALRMSSASITGTWYLFHLRAGAAGVTLRDLTLDGSGATAATTARLVQIGAGAGDAAIRTTLNGVVLRGARGSAVQATGRGVDGVTLLAARLESNAGIGLDLQDGARNIQVFASTFTGDAGADIAASSLAAPLGPIVIRGNVIARADSAVAISLTGSAANPGIQTSLQGNLVVNGRIQIAGFDRAELIDNFILSGTGAAPEHALSIGRARSMIVRANFIANQSSSTGSALFANAGGTDGIQAASIDGNVLFQSSNAPIARLTWANDLTFTGNQLTFTSPTEGAAGVAIGSTASLVANLVLSHNVIAGDPGGGSLATAFRIGPGDGVLGRVLVTGNTSRGAAIGVTFDPASTTQATPLVAANEFRGSSTDIAGLSTSIPAAAVGANVATTGAHQLTGSGAPTLSAPTGSLFLRRDGGGGLYVREGTSWRPL